MLRIVMILVLASAAGCSATLAAGARKQYVPADPAPLAGVTGHVEVRVEL